MVGRNTATRWWVIIENCDAVVYNPAAFDCSKGKIEFDQNREMADKNGVNRNLNLNLLLETLLLRGAAVGF